MRLTQLFSPTNQSLIFVLAITINTIQAQSYQFEESGGLVIMEAESTPSPYGLWILNTTTDPKNITGEGSLEYANGEPVGYNGPMSPLEYTFKINQAGIYFLHLHCAKLDQEVDGIPRVDVANDCFVRMEGDYEARNPDPEDVFEVVNGKKVYDPKFDQNDAPLTMLRDNTKFFGGRHKKFAWSSGVTLDPGGHKNKRACVYRFKEGEVYKLVVHGRSGDFKINRIMLRLSSIDRKVAENLNNPETLGQPIGPVINSLSITNIDDYDNFTDDIVINTDLAGTADLHIRANTTPAQDFGKVVFELTGATTSTWTDKSYTWDFKARKRIPEGQFSYGEHTLTVTPYDTENIAGTPFIVNIDVQKGASKSPYELWEENNDLPRNSANLDTDNDGHTNKYEFLFGLDPNNPLNPRRYTHYINEDGYLTINYTRRRNESITYTVEISQDLTQDSWKPLADEDYAITNGPTVNSDGTETLSLTYETAIKDIVDRLFINIKASE